MTAHLGRGHGKTLLCLIICGMCLCSRGNGAPSQSELDELQDRWAVIYYKEKGKVSQIRDISDLAEQAGRLNESASNNVDALVWQAIILSSKAQIEGGIAALRDAELARDILLHAKDLNVVPENSLVDTSLGVLYDKVPGWPVGFGDAALAKMYLQRGLSQDPDGLDANFFYGEFLYSSGDYSLARKVLEHALEAPCVGNRTAYLGRRDEVKDLIAKINERGD